MNHGPRADADHDVVSLVMGFFQKVHIVGRHHGDSQVLGKFQKGAIAQTLRFDSVIVKLQIKVSLTKDIDKFAR